MNYREIAPTGAAAEIAKCYWMLEGEAPSSDIQRILPDGRCELILNFGESFENLTETGWVPQPQWFATGQITSPFLVRPRGRTCILGIRFHPHAFAPVLGSPAHQLTDKAVPIDCLSSKVARQFERLADCTAPGEQTAILDGILPAGTQPARMDPQIAAAVQIFERALPAIPIGEAARLVGLSLRQFERRFIAAVGISPKLFCRMQRFQRVVRAMDSPQANWVDVAAECGYYDQAHLIRDFREFAGDAPTVLLDQEIHLARHFARR